MEYINENKKNSDCAIVGAYNALIWLNKKADYNQIERIAKKYYKYNPESGLKYRFLNDFMSYLKVPIKPLGGITIQEAEKEILNGNAVLALITRESDKVKHVVVLRPHENGIAVLNESLSWIEIVLGFKKKELRLELWTIGIVK